MTSRAVAKRQQASAIAEVVKSGLQSGGSILESILTHPAAGGLLALMANQLAYKQGLWDPRVTMIGAKDYPAMGYFRAFVPPELSPVTREWWWDPAPYTPPSQPSPSGDPENDARFQYLSRLPEGTIFTHLCGLDHTELCWGSLDELSVKQAHGIPIGADLEHRTIDFGSFYITEVAYNGQIVGRAAPTGQWTPPPIGVLGHWRVEKITPWTAEPIAFPGYTSELLEGGTDQNVKPPAINTYQIITGGYFWDSPTVQEGSQLLVTVGSPHARYWYEWHRTQEARHEPGKPAMGYHTHDWGFGNEGGFHLDLGTVTWHWVTDPDKIEEMKEQQASDNATGMAVFITVVSGIYALGPKHNILK